MAFKDMLRKFKNSDRKFSKNDHSVSCSRMQKIEDIRISYRLLPLNEGDTAGPLLVAFYDKQGMRRGCAGDSRGILGAGSTLEAKQVVKKFANILVLD